MMEFEFSRDDKIKYVAISTALSFGFYILSVIFSQFVATYRTKLKFKEKVFWHMTIVRAIFGLYGSVVGFHAIFISKPLNDNVVHGQTFMSWVALSFTVGFFIFECLLVTSVDIFYGGFQILLNLHHWLGLLSYSASLYYGKAQFFGCTGLILEMSTPCSALCWTLLKCKLSHTLLWKINQFVLVHLFHLRSVVECYMWYVTYKNFDLIINEVPMLVLILMYTGLTTLTFIMTPYWTYRKTQQLIIPYDFNFQQQQSSSANNQVANGDIKKCL